MATKKAKAKKTNDETELVHLGIKIDAEIKAKLEALAADDDRTTSDYIRRVLRHHVEGKK